MKMTVNLQISPEEFEKALRDAYLERTDQYVVPGVAPGLASRDIIEKIYGRDALFDEALGLCAPAVFGEYLEENRLRPAGRPKLTEAAWLDSGGVAFTVTFDPYPEVRLGRYLGIETAVSPEDPEAFAAAVLTQACLNMTLPDGAIVEVPEGMARQKLDAMLAGEKLRAGQDPIYQLLSDVAWLLKRAYKKVGVSRPSSQVQAEAMDVMLQIVEDKGDFQASQALCRRLISDLAARYRPLSEDFEEFLSGLQRERALLTPEARVDDAFGAYLGSLDMDEAQWRRQNHERAAQSARFDLLLTAVAEQEGLQVTEEELADVVQRIAEEAQLEPAEVAARVDLDPIRGQILRDKARELILRSAVCTCA